MVPRLPPPAGGATAAARQGLRHALATSSGPARARPRVGRQVRRARTTPFDFMLGVSPMNSRKDFTGASGRAYWRSLEEFAAGPEFRELIEQEFPALQSVGPDEMSRRRFLTLMGASLALA